MNVRNNNYLMLIFQYLSLLSLEQTVNEAFEILLKLIRKDNKSAFICNKLEIG